VRFNGVPIIINYNNKLTNDERDLLATTYGIHKINEINYECRGWDNAKKSVYIQAADWIRLIPKDLLKSDNLIISLPRDLPYTISVYMVTEMNALVGKFPKDS